MDLRREGTSSYRPYDYDVVITCNGEGEELRFVDGLYHTLVESGVCAFKITHRVRRSDIDKVRKSRISIFVLSKEFASSVWLLRELVTIIESTKASETLIVPIFYNVDPSEIREQTGSIAAVFARYDKQYLFEQVETWRIALRQASDLTGFLFARTTDIHESARIHHIVDFIAEGLKKGNISLWCDRECHLLNTGLSVLPENMTFPALTKLYLQENYDLSDIPLSFFEFMPILKVLDLSRTSIKDLPPSISHLVQLKKLLLRDCKLLMELPPEIQALKNLEVFDLAGTELIYIPKEIKMLSRLERLVVSLCDCADEYVSEITENGEIIPRNTLSKLSNLKELSIFVDPACEWWYTEVEAIVQDLFSLEKLETVKMYFPTVELLRNFLQLPSVKNQALTNFRLIVGRHDQGIISRVPRDLQDSFETLNKCLKYVNGEENMDIVGEALKHCSAFFLDRHWTIDQLSRFKHNEMEKLRFCMLIECNEMVNVIEEGDNGGKPVLEFLQYLCIYYMKNLESILVGPLAIGSLYNLQVLDLHTCPKLSTVFNIGLLINLVNLKELIVEDCPKVESIVCIQSLGLETGEEFLPSLEKISLLHLPGLVSISNGLCVATRLVSMVIYNCPKLQSKSLVEIANADIKEIKGESLWWEALKWKSNQPDYLSRVFVPLSGDGLINQLAEARISCNSLSMIESFNEDQKNPTKMKGKTQDKHMIQTQTQLKFNPETHEDLSEALDKNLSDLLMSEVQLEAPPLNEDISYSKSSPSDPTSYRKKIRAELQQQAASFTQKNKNETASSKSEPEISQGPNKLKSNLEKLQCPPDGEFNQNITSWQKGRFLGSGLSGNVYEGITDDGIYFAVKEVSLLDLGSYAKQSSKQIEREISLLSQFEHENIVPYLGTDKDDSKVYIFRELVTKGSLEKLYQKFNLLDSQVSGYTRQILSGLSYLHAQNVAHMNIKCSNILVDISGSVKLADFGLRKATKRIWGTFKSVKYFLYCPWMAPEVVKGVDCGLASDIWSLGCTVLEMLTQQVPYSPLEGMQAMFYIRRGQLPRIPDSLSEDARDFILSCLQVNPDSRPSAVELSNHAFVK